MATKKAKKKVAPFKFRFATKQLEMVEIQLAKLCHVRGCKKPSNGCPENCECMAKRPVNLPLNYVTAMAWTASDQLEAALEVCDNVEENMDIFFDDVWSIDSIPYVVDRYQMGQDFEADISQFNELRSKLKAFHEVLDFHRHLDSRTIRLQNLLDRACERISAQKWKLFWFIEGTRFKKKMAQLKAEMDRH